MNYQTVETTARTLVSFGKGILPADESYPTIQKRFSQINVHSTEETRREYRQILFSTADIERFISGVILFEETLRQSTPDGKPMISILEAKGILPGIKVDKGTRPMAGFPMETVTQGLDGLRERLIEYTELGARFAKWRAIIRIGSNIPTQTCIDTNAQLLARYAALCQEVDLVPIVEPEVLMAGDHSLDRCENVTTTVLESIFSELHKERVFLEGVLLKPNMVTPGEDCTNKASVAEVAEATIRCLKRAVPAALPGIVFLSGGQSPELATRHLNAINATKKYPWELSFSFGRALQQPVLYAWKGNPANVSEAQNAFYHRAACNHTARYGNYSKIMEVR